MYLARQLSLDRRVPRIKVSANRGNEARTLASLEHDHIVRVFSEVVDQEKNLRLVCMQSVAARRWSMSFRCCATGDPQKWSGRALLDAIDKLSTDSVPFDPTALRDREALTTSDFAEAVCWLGGRVAEALAHAHNQGVLHRDVKPANILLNHYGRPLLADFNVALDRQRVADPPAPSSAARSPTWRAGASTPSIRTSHSRRRWWTLARMFTRSAWCCSSC